MIKISSLFLLWVTFLALFVTITGLGTQVGLPAQIFQILFLPVTLFLAFSLFRHLVNHTPALDSLSGWKRLIVYYCFIVSSALVIVSFSSAHTLPQLISSIIFAPLALYFFILVRPRLNRAIYLPSTAKKSPIQPNFATDTISLPKLDLDRRDFLKMIGAAGLSVFVYSLLSKRGQGSFLGGVSSAETLALKDMAGNKIDPAEKSPTHGYYISQIDDSTIAYFGFVNKLGQWFIMRQDTDNAYRYSRGDNNFSASWTNRSVLTYNYFDNVF